MKTRSDNPFATLFANALPNIANKAPKILMLVLVMFVLSMHAGWIFGVKIDAKTNLGKANVVTAVSRETLNTHYGVDVALETSDSVYFVVYDRVSGDGVGAMISSEKFADRSNGYAGETPLVFLLDNAQVIRKVVPLANDETPRFMQRLEDEGFFAQWEGKHLFDDFSDIDAQTGATYSSVSLIANADAALGAVVATHKPHEVTYTHYVGAFAVLSVVVLSLVCYLFPKPMRRFRLPLLLLSVAVLGIWQGAFVSVSLLYNWLLYGVTLAQSFALFAILILAVVLPLITNKQFYCQWVCPFGAAQEIIGRCYPRKIGVPAVALAAFRWVKRLILVAIVVLLFANPNFDPADVEPFTLFAIKAASVSAIIIAAVSLVASIFIAKPWCRLLCPTGEIFLLLGRKITYKKTRK